MEAMKAGRHDEAIAKFNEVIAKMPTCADCYYNLGVAYVAQAGVRAGRGRVQEGRSS